MDLRPADLIFVHETDLIAEIIEDVTRSKYSHVAIYIGNNTVIEAQGFRKVGDQALSYYDGKYDVVRVPMDNEQILEGIEWLLKQKGRPYDYWDIFVLLVRCTLQLKIPWREGKAIICSRLGRDFLFECGLPIPDENMTPEDLFEWIVKHDGVLIAA